MSALAAFLISEGYRVSGSDAAESSYTERVRSLGGRVFIPHSPENIRNENVIIYTSAVSGDNAELSFARALGKMIFSRAQFLSMVAGNFSHTIYVAGSHGKTTTTAMLSHIFCAAEKDFACHIGGNDLTFKNFFKRGENKDFFISEACEYKKNIAYLSGETALLLNADPDHLECYSGKEELFAEYLKYLSRAEHKIIPPSFKNAESDGITFSAGGDYYAENITVEKERYSFDIIERDEFLCSVSLNVRGQHNINNALASAAAARVYGINGAYIAAGLKSFQGVERRFEYIGSFNGALVYCDYAHHPREISAVLASAHKIAEKRLFTVFQPHTYSRTKFLMDDFVSALKNEENLLVYATYPAREAFDKDGSAELLARKIPCEYADSVNSLRSFLSGAEKGDIILVLGAGDIYALSKIAISACK